MKLHCATDRLAKSLSVVGRAIGSRGSLQILDNVLLHGDLDGQRLKLVGTNLEIAITYWLAAEVAEGGATTVPARLLTKFVGSLPAGTLNIASNDRHGLALGQGGYKANIHGMDADDFPAIPEVVAASTVRVAASELRRAIDQVVVAAAGDDTRPVLSGVLMRFEDDGLTMAAADGFRLAVRTLALGSEVPERRDAIVPAKALHELARCLNEAKDTVTISLAPAHAHFDLGDVALVSRLIEGTFPNYTPIIPIRHDCRVVVGTKALQQAVRVAMLFARDASNIVRLHAQTSDDGAGQWTVGAEANDLGDTTTNMQAQIEGEVEIRFNGHYLAEALNVVGTAEVELRCTGPGAPALLLPVGGPDYQHVMMPMQTTR